MAICFASALSGRKIWEYEPELECEMRFGLLHTLFNDACENTGTILVWSDGEVTHRSQRRKDGMPYAKAGPTVPVDSTIQVHIVAGGDGVVID